jgi:hypothetical protein
MNSVHDVSKLSACGGYACNFVCTPWEICMSKSLMLLFAVILPLAGGAADGTYPLYEGIVKISAPADWPVILKKTEGIPQFIAFQVSDPAAQSSGESSQVSVEAKLLNDGSTTQALVNAGMEKAKQTPGYEARADGNGADALHYTALNGKQRYEYRESWAFSSRMLTHVRCSRPLLAATTAAWTKAYETGCEQIMQSAKRH